MPCSLAEVNTLGRRLNGFLVLSLNEWNIIFLVTLLDKTVTVRQDSLCITMPAYFM